MATDAPANSETISQGIQATPKTVGFLYLLTFGQLDDSADGSSGFDGGLVALYAVMGR